MLNVILQTSPSPFLDLLNNFIQSETYYVLIFVIFGWMAFDRYVRKKYVVHICQEEGNNLQEVKHFSKPLSWANKMLEWDVKLRGTKNVVTRYYKLDPKNVVFTDRFNKRHIVGSADNVFNFHPYSDKEGEIKFTTIARASAEDLGSVIGKAGFLSRMEAIANTIGIKNRQTILALVGVGIVIGMAIIAIYPAPFGLEHIIPTIASSSSTSSSSTSITSQTSGISITSLGG